MNILLWILQVVAALVYGASGVMKTFMFDKVSHDVSSFGALPRNIWMILGIIELICAVGLIVPGAIAWHRTLTTWGAVILAVESLVFITVHVKYREASVIVMSGVLGLLMMFVAYGRFVLMPFADKQHHCL
jgi:hypothetical protein